MLGLIAYFTNFSYSVGEERDLKTVMESKKEMKEKVRLQVFISLQRFLLIFNSNQINLGDVHCLLLKN